jgi:hypothetical protein
MRINVNKTRDLAAFSHKKACVFVQKSAVLPDSTKSCASRRRRKNGHKPSYFQQHNRSVFHVKQNKNIGARQKGRLAPHFHFHFLEFAPERPERIALFPNFRALPA